LSDWPDLTAHGEWSGSRLTQDQGKSPGPDTEQLGKVFPHVTADGTKETRSEPMLGPTKAVVELFQKTGWLLARDTTATLAGDSI
jgi:hypothetical protein